MLIVKTIPLLNNADMDCDILYAKSIFVDGQPYATCLHHHYMGN